MFCLGLGKIAEILSTKSESAFEDLINKLKPSHHEGNSRK